MKVSYVESHGFRTQFFNAHQHTNRIYFLLVCALSTALLACGVSKRFPCSFAFKERVLDSRNTQNQLDVMYARICNRQVRTDDIQVRVIRSPRSHQAGFPHGTQTVNPHNKHSTSRHHNSKHQVHDTQANKQVKYPNTHRDDSGCAGCDTFGPNHTAGDGVLGHSITKRS